MYGWMLALALMAAEGTAKTAAPAAAPMTVQARFDAASQAAAEQRCTEAVAQYEAIEQMPAIMRNTLARASIALRKGVCLIDLGRYAEGEASVRQGLPLLEAKGADFAGDVRDGRLALANAARIRFDYDTGIAEAEKALALSKGVLRIRPLQTLATLTLFDGDGRALRFTEEARTLIAADPAFTKRELATVQTLHARALLNAGRHQEAYALLKDSLAKQGGLDLKVSFGDIATRSDLAIAALLNGDDERARQYLAFTGAGRIADAPFNRAAAMDPPVCDPAIGLKPSDIAIVEFSLRDDGQVGSVQPIYVTGDRRAALAFAQAVTRWSWTQEDAKAVPPFFRALSRVELRCTRRGDVPSIMSPLREAAEAALSPDAAPQWHGMSDAAALPLQRAAFERQDGDPRLRLLAGLGLIANPVFGKKESQAVGAQVEALAKAQDLAVPVRAWIALLRIGLSDMSSTRTLAAIRALIDDPALGSDPVASATFRLMLASPERQRKEPRDAAALLDAVIAEPDLPARHPLKVNAMLRRADLFAAQGDTSAAAAMVAKTGLTAEQCAMLGVTPALRGVGARNFPQTAMQWGFEGWVRNEFDIGSDGRPIAPRAVIAYPPFVFNKAAADISDGSRWTSSYRGDQPVACAASVQQIKFLMP